MKSVTLILSEGNGVLKHIGHLVEIYQGGSWECLTCNKKR